MTIYWTYPLESCLGRSVKRLDSPYIESKGEFSKRLVGLSKALKREIPDGQYFLGLDQLVSAVFKNKNTVINRLGSHISLPESSLKYILSNCESIKLIIDMPSYQSVLAEAFASIVKLRGAGFCACHSSLEKKLKNMYEASKKIDFMV